MGKGETVATIGNKEITRQEWLDEMEIRYGQSTLREMIDQKVIEQMAKRHHIAVNEEDVEREWTMLKTTSYIYGHAEDEEQLKQQIKNSLLLEELITKDVAVSAEELRNYYHQNKSLFVNPTSYHLSQIIVKTKAEAQQTVKELKQGSSFAVLAMERSIDEFSAYQGGDIGFVSKEDGKISDDTVSEMEKLKDGEWSKPVKTEEGYVIYLLHERVPAKKYSFEQVKNQIRRQIAIEQMDIPITANTFWKEAEVEWFYEDH